MRPFDYRGDDLYCEGVRLAALAEAAGTPAYVYSRGRIAENYQAFDSAFGARRHLLCYSVKACSTLGVLATLRQLGAGADIVSGGELMRALRAGIDPTRIVFSGVGKRDDEIEQALAAGILFFNVESHDELVALERIAARLGRRAPVSLRVNPDVDAETHPYISTGLKKNKFGIPWERARAEYAFAKSQPHLDLRGIDCHIGSQLLKTTPFRDAIGRVARLVRELAADGIPLRYLDVGGGLGIAYKEGEPGAESDDAPPTKAEYAEAIAAATSELADLGLTIVCEPGRSIVGDAGALLTRVLYLKQGETKSFVIVDAAFNDLMRPALYGSYHALRPLRRRPGATSLVADVVGPICETGDFFARDRELSQPERGDLFAILAAGAYGASMSSTYNTRPRAVEILVDGDRYDIIRQRETLDDLLRGETLPGV